MVVHEVDRVIYIVHVDGRISIGADKCCEINKVTQHHEAIAPQRKFKYTQRRRFHEISQHTRYYQYQQQAAETKCAIIARNDKEWQKRQR